MLSKVYFPILVYKSKTPAAKVRLHRRFRRREEPSGHLSNFATPFLEHQTAPRQHAHTRPTHNLPAKTELQAYW